MSNCNPLTQNTLKIYNSENKLLYQTCVPLTDGVTTIDVNTTLEIPHGLDPIILHHEGGIYESHPIILPAGDYTAELIEPPDREMPPGHPRSVIVEEFKIEKFPEIGYCVDVKKKDDKWAYVVTYYIEGEILDVMSFRDNDGNTFDIKEKAFEVSYHDCKPIIAIFSIQDVVIPNTSFRFRIEPLELPVILVEEGCPSTDFEAKLNTNFNVISNLNQLVIDTRGSIGDHLDVIIDGQVESEDFGFRIFDLNDTRSIQMRAVMLQNGTIDTKTISLSDYPIYPDIYELRIYKKDTVAIDEEGNSFVIWKEGHVEYLNELDPGVSWDNRYPFNRIRPCWVREDGFVEVYFDRNDLTKIEEVTHGTNIADPTNASRDYLDRLDGNMMVEIPNLYYNTFETDEYVYVQISHKEYTGVSDWKATNQKNGRIHDTVYFGIFFSKQIQYTIDHIEYNYFNSNRLENHYFTKDEIRLTPQQYREGIQGLANKAAKDRGLFDAFTLNNLTTLRILSLLRYGSVEKVLVEDIPADLTTITKESGLKEEAYSKRKFACLDFPFGFGVQINQDAPDENSSTEWEMSTNIERFKNGTVHMPAIFDAYYTHDNCYPVTRLCSGLSCAELGLRTLYEATNHPGVFNQFEFSQTEEYYSSHFGWHKPSQVLSVADGEEPLLMSPIAGNTQNNEFQASFGSVMSPMPNKKLFNQPTAQGEQVYSYQWDYQLLYRPVWWKENEKYKLDVTINDKEGHDIVLYTLPGQLTVVKINTNSIGWKQIVTVNGASHTKERIHRNFEDANRLVDEVYATFGAGEHIITATLHDTNDNPIEAETMNIRVSVVELPVVDDSIIHVSPDLTNAPLISLNTRVIWTADSEQLRLQLNGLIFEYLQVFYIKKIQGGESVLEELVPLENPNRFLTPNTPYTGQFILTPSPQESCVVRVVICGPASPCPPGIAIDIPVIVNENFIKVQPKSVQNDPNVLKISQLHNGDWQIIGNQGFTCEFEIIDSSLIVTNKAWFQSSQPSDGLARATGWPNDIVAGNHDAITAGLNTTIDERIRLLNSNPTDPNNPGIEQIQATLDILLGREVATLSEEDRQEISRLERTITAKRLEIYELLQQRRYEVFSSVNATTRHSFSWKFPYGNGLQYEVYFMAHRTGSRPDDIATQRIIIIAIDPKNPADDIASLKYNQWINPKSVLNVTFLGTTGQRLYMDWGNGVKTRAYNLVDERNERISLEPDDFKLRHQYLNTTPQLVTIYIEGAFSTTATESFFVTGLSPIYTVRIDESKLYPDGNDMLEYPGITLCKEDSDKFIDTNAAREAPLTSIVTVRDPETGIETDTIVHHEDKFDDIYPFNSIDPVLVHQDNQGLSIRRYVDNANWKIDNAGNTIPRSLFVNNNLMIEIPPFWFKIERGTPRQNNNSNIIDVSICADNPEDNGTWMSVHPNSETCLYVGALLKSEDRSFDTPGTAVSILDTKPQVSRIVNRNNWSHDSSFKLVDYNIWTALQCLFLLRYRTINSSRIFSGINPYDVDNIPEIEVPHEPEQFDCIPFSSNHPDYLRALEQSDALTLAQFNGNEAAWIAARLRVIEDARKAIEEAYTNCLRLNEIEANRPIDEPDTTRIQSSSDGFLGIEHLWGFRPTLLEGIRWKETTSHPNGAFIVSTLGGGESEYPIVINTHINRPLISSVVGNNTGGFLPKNFEGFPEEKYRDVVKINGTEDVFVGVPTYLYTEKGVDYDDNGLFAIGNRTLNPHYDSQKPQSDENAPFKEYFTERFMVKPSVPVNNDDVVRLGTLLQRPLNCIYADNDGNELTITLQGDSAYRYLFWDVLEGPDSPKLLKEAKDTETRLTTFVREYPRPQPVTDTSPLEINIFAVDKLWKVKRNPEITDPETTYSYRTNIWIRGLDADIDIYPDTFTLDDPVFVDARLLGNGPGCHQDGPFAESITVDWDNGYTDPETNITYPPVVETRMLNEHGCDWLFKYIYRHQFEPGKPQYTIRVTVNGGKYSNGGTFTKIINLSGLMCIYNFPVIAGYCNYAQEGGGVERRGFEMEPDFEGTEAQYMMFYSNHHDKHDFKESDECPDGYTWNGTQCVSPGGEVARYALELGTEERSRIKHEMFLRGLTHLRWDINGDLEEHQLIDTWIREDGPYYRQARHRSSYEYEDPNLPASERNQVAIEGKPIDVFQRVYDFGEIDELSYTYMHPGIYYPRFVLWGNETTTETTMRIVVLDIGESLPDTSGISIDKPDTDLEGNENDGRTVRINLPVIRPDTPYARSVHVDWGDGTSVRINPDNIYALVSPRSTEALLRITEEYDPNLRRGDNQIPTLGAKVTVITYKNEPKGADGCPLGYTLTGGNCISTTPGRPCTPEQMWNPVLGTCVPRTDIPEGYTWNNTEKRWEWKQGWEETHNENYIYEFEHGNIEAFKEWIGETFANIEVITWTEADTVRDGEREIFIGGTVYLRCKEKGDYTIEVKLDWFYTWMNGQIVETEPITDRFIPFKDLEIFWRDNGPRIDVIQQGNDGVAARDVETITTHRYRWDGIFDVVVTVYGDYGLIDIYRQTVWSYPVYGVAIHDEGRPLMDSRVEYAYDALGKPDPATGQTSGMTHEEWDQLWMFKDMRMVLYNPRAPRKNWLDEDSPGVIAEINPFNVYQALRYRDIRPGSLTEGQILTNVNITDDVTGAYFDDERLRIRDRLIAEKMADGMNERDAIQSADREMAGQCISDYSDVFRGDVMIEVKNMYFNFRRFVWPFRKLTKGFYTNINNTTHTTEAFNCTLVEVCDKKLDKDWGATSRHEGSNRKHSYISAYHGSYESAWSGMRSLAMKTYWRESFDGIAREAQRNGYNIMRWNHATCFHLLHLLRFESADSTELGPSSLDWGDLGELNIINEGIASDYINAFFPEAGARTYKFAGVLEPASGNLGSWIEGIRVSDKHFLYKEKTEYIDECDPCLTKSICDLEPIKRSHGVNVIPRIDSVTGNVLAWAMTQLDNPGAAENSSFFLPLAFVSSDLGYQVPCPVPEGCQPDTPSGDLVTTKAYFLRSHTFVGDNHWGFFHTADYYDRRDEITGNQLDPNVQKFVKWGCGHIDGEPDLFSLYVATNRGGTTEKGSQVENMGEYALFTYNDTEKLGDTIINHREYNFIVEPNPQWITVQKPSAVVYFSIEKTDPDYFQLTDQISFGFNNSDFVHGLTVTGASFRGSEPVVMEVFNPSTNTYSMQPIAPSMTAHTYTVPGKYLTNVLISDEWSAKIDVKHKNVEIFGVNVQLTLDRIGTTDTYKIYEGQLAIFYCQLSYGHRIEFIPYAGATKQTDVPDTFGDDVTAHWKFFHRYETIGTKTATVTVYQTVNGVDIRQETKTITIEVESLKANIRMRVAEDFYIKNSTGDFNDYWAIAVSEPIFFSMRESSQPPATVIFNPGDGTDTYRLNPPYKTIHTYRSVGLFRPSVTVCTGDSVDDKCLTSYLVNNGEDIRNYNQWDTSSGDNSHGWINIFAHNPIAHIRPQETRPSEIDPETGLLTYRVFHSTAPVLFNTSGSRYARTMNVFAYPPSSAGGFATIGQAVSQSPTDPNIWILTPGTSVDNPLMPSGIWKIRVEVTGFNEESPDNEQFHEIAVEIIPHRVELRAYPCSLEPDPIEGWPEQTSYIVEGMVPLCVQFVAEATMNYITVNYGNAIREDDGTVVSPDTVERIGRNADGKFEWQRDNIYVRMGTYHPAAWIIIDPDQPNSTIPSETRPEIIVGQPNLQILSVTPPSAFAPVEVTVTIRSNAGWVTIDFDANPSDILPNVWNYDPFDADGNLRSTLDDNNNPFAVIVNDSDGDPMLFVRINGFVDAAADPEKRVVYVPNPDGEITVRYTYNTGGTYFIRAVTNKNSHVYDIQRTVDYRVLALGAGDAPDFIRFIGETITIDQTEANGAWIELFPGDYRTVTDEIVEGWSLIVNPDTGVIINPTVLATVVEGLWNQGIKLVTLNDGTQDIHFCMIYYKENRAGIINGRPWIFNIPYNKVSDPIFTYKTVVYPAMPSYPLAEELGLELGAV